MKDEADFYDVCDAGGQGFLMSATPDGKIFYFLLLHTRVQLRAARIAFMLLLGVSQEVAKKETQAFPLGTPAALPQDIRRGGAASGFLCRQGSGKGFLPFRFA